MLTCLRTFQYQDPTNPFAYHVPSCPRKHPTPQAWTYLRFNSRGPPQTWHCSKAVQSNEEKRRYFASHSIPSHSPKESSVTWPNVFLERRAAARSQLTLRKENDHDRQPIRDPRHPFRFARLSTIIPPSPQTRTPLTLEKSNRERRLGLGGPLRPSRRATGLSPRLLLVFRRRGRLGSSRGPFRRNLDGRGLLGGLGLRLLGLLHLERLDHRRRVVEVLSRLPSVVGGRESLPLDKVHVLHAVGVDARLHNGLNLPLVRGHTVVGGGGLFGRTTLALCGGGILYGASETWNFEWHGGTLTSVLLGRPRVGFLAALAARRALAATPVVRTGRPRFLAAGSSALFSSSASRSAAFLLRSEPFDATVLFPDLGVVAVLFPVLGVFATVVRAGVSDAERLPSEGRPRFLWAVTGGELNSSSSSSTTSMSATGADGLASMSSASLSKPTTVGPTPGEGASGCATAGSSST